MSPHDIPPLIPKPPEKDWADYNTNPDPGRTRKRRRASMLSARDVLALPTVTLLHPVPRFPIVSWSCRMLRQSCLSPTLNAHVR